MSIWKNFDHNIKILDSDKNVDILVIGGGLTGLLTAYRLMNKDICVVEARSIGSGITKNTTAKITYLQDRVYTKISSLSGKNNARLYLNSQLKAIKEYKNIIDKNKIDCDFTRVSSYVFANSEREKAKLKKEMNFLKKACINVVESELPLDIKSFFSYKVDDTYQFNPLKFLKGLYDILTKSDIPIYENTKVYSVKRVDGVYVCDCGDFFVKAKKVVFASGYPYFLYPIFLPFKSYIEKSYMCVKKVSEFRNFSCISSSYPVYSTRFYKDGNDVYQICLSGSHNAAFNQNDKKNFDKVKLMFNLSNDEIIQEYSNNDIITADYLPLIGEIKENMFIGCAYNTWGMTNSMLASLIISDLIKSHVSEYKFLFNPKRFNFQNIIKLPYFMFSQFKSYISSKVCRDKSWYEENVKVSDVGVYVDELGVEHKVKNKCPHMGCSLIFNESEKTWDCPCHSSRFDVDGNVIKGPSNKNIKL